MPKLTVIDSTLAPPMTSTDAKVRQRQELYQGFINSVLGTGMVGELHLEENDRTRSVMICLQRASSRLHRPLKVWSVNNSVFFNIN